jgi:DNA-binding response OmpR family regulator
MPLISGTGSMSNIEEINTRVTIIADQNVVLEIDLLNHRLLLDGKEILLTPKAFIVLKYLVFRAGDVISREELLINVWNWKPNVSSDTRAIDHRIAELRRKLGCNIKQPKFIETVLGRGYRFVARVNVESP